LTRTKRCRNIKSSIGRSQRTNDIHSLLREESIQLIGGQEQNTIAKQIFKDINTKFGDEYFVINSVWFRSWKKFVGFEGEVNGDNPGSIDNTKILSDQQNVTNFVALKKDLKPSEYELVPKKLWKKLQAWYGGGPSISRKMIIRGTVTQYLEVELYPLRLRVMKMETEEIKQFDFASSSSLKGIRRVIACKWGLPLVKCALYQHDQELTIEEHMNKTLQQLRIDENQLILMRNSAETPFGLSGKIMGICNIYEKPTLVERILPNSIKDSSIHYKPSKTTNNVVLYVLPLPDVEHKPITTTIENSKATNLKEIVSDICKENGIEPIVSLCNTKQHSLGDVNPTQVAIAG